MTALATSQGAGRLGDPQALTDGFSAAFLGAAGIAVAGALLGLVTLRRPAHNQSPQTPRPDPAEPAQTPAGEASISVR